MAKYLDKVQNLMSAMEHNGFETFDGDRKEACDTVESAIMSFPDYTNTVIRQQVVMKMLPFRDLTTEEFQQTVTQLDTQRRNVHNVAIGNMNLLNRLSELNGQDKIFQIDTSDRHAVADAVGTFVNEVYNDGIGNTLDSATLDRTVDYDPTVAKQAIHNRPLPDISNISGTSESQFER